MGLGGIGCSAKCAKYLLIFFNIIFWLTGAGLLGVGIWVLVDSASFSYIINFVGEIDGINSEDSSIRIIAYLFIGVGAFVFVSAFCGCCGALKESKCLLGLYAFLLVVAMAAEIAGGALAAVYRKQLLDNAREKGIQFIQNTYTNTKAADYGLNWVQQEYKCCGITGVRDYTNSTYVMGYSGQVPHTVSPYCCKMNDGYKFDKKTPDVQNEALCMSEANACQTQSCPSPLVALRSTDCLSKIEDWIKDNLPIFIGLGIGIAVFQIFILLLSICLCRQIGKDD